ncbi:MAG TPA: hypothetical protein VHK44_03535, partial [Xanthobacteraceae bacterium]|nr:hypothetical protein [Xanthobacteraceae bacterium]
LTVKNKRNILLSSSARAKYRAVIAILPWHASFKALKSFTGRARSAKVDTSFASERAPTLGIERFLHANWFPLRLKTL